MPTLTKLLAAARLYGTDTREVVNCCTVPTLTELFTVARLQGKIQGRPSVMQDSLIMCLLQPIPF